MNATSTSKRTNKMKAGHIFPYFCICMILTSCMAMDMEPSFDMSPDMPNISGFLEGRVSDGEGNPIEHIRITVDWNTADRFQEIKYSGSDGMFSVTIYDLGHNGPVTITLTMEDIDGEENGGLFESITDTITLFEDADSSYESNNAGAMLDYRLSPATASESSPQS